MPIRRIKKEDKDQILALDKIIFSTVDPDGGWRESDFNQFFNEDSCYIFYEEERPERVIGYIFTTQKEDHTYISNLGSDPRPGIRGIGTALMEKVMVQEAENAKKNNHPIAIRLHVDNENEHAIRFYKNLGFQEDGSDSHGIKMLIRELPEKFQNKKILAPVPKPSQALIIRNVEGIQYDDLKVALEGLESNEQAPPEFNELITLIRNNRLLEREQLYHALNLFKLEQVRNYIYETVKEKTGNHIIYHLNGLGEYGIENNKNVSYITDKLAKIPVNTDFDLMYLGGGHGAPVGGSSNLNNRQLKSIIDSLNTRTIQFSAVVLGSCFSAAYLALYQPLLKARGVMIAHSLECGGNNNFKQVMEWIKGQKKEFYSQTDIQNFITVSEKTREDIKRVLEGIGFEGEALHDEYQQLQYVYKHHITTAVQGLPEAEITTLAEELFHKNLEEFIIAIQLEFESINKEKIQQILRNIPNLHAHIQVISHKKGENVFFDTLINYLKPAPSSLVLAGSKTLTMFNFDASMEIPLNAAADFQDNYHLVRGQITQTGLFSEIHEVTDGFDDIWVRRQFNDLLVQAIESSEQKRLERQQELEELKRRTEQERLERQQKLEELRRRSEQECLERQQEIEELRRRAEQERLERQRQESEKQRPILEEHKKNQQAFVTQLQLLANKIQDLNERGMKNAHQAALTLHTQLESAGISCFNNRPSLDSYNIFQKNCNDYIKEARKELDHHREWSAFLVNFSLVIGTLCIGLLIKGAINLANNRAFFFVHDTDSGKRLNAMEETVNNVSVLCY